MDEEVIGLSNRHSNLTLTHEIETVYAIAFLSLRITELSQGSFVVPKEHPCNCYAQLRRTRVVTI